MSKGSAVSKSSKNSKYALNRTYSGDDDDALRDESIKGISLNVTKEVSLHEEGESEKPRGPSLA